MFIYGNKTPRRIYSLRQTFLKACRFITDTNVRKLHYVLIKDFDIFMTKNKLIYAGKHFYQ